MIIRKLFKYEMSHRVLGAFTKRCSENVHGHSYKLEMLFEGVQPDAAQMVMDFGLVKKYFHPFVDSFDHAHCLWNIDSQVADHEMAYIKEWNQRWISLPFSSTAEMQAKMFYTFGSRALSELRVQKLIPDRTTMHAVRVHETDTGYAEYNKDHADYNWDNTPSCQFPRVHLKDIEFSLQIQDEWPVEFQEFYAKLAV